MTTAKQRTLGPCMVCDGKSIGLNFGVATCMACKAFFRRNAVKLGVSVDARFRKETNSVLVCSTTNLSVPKTATVRSRTITVVSAIVVDWPNAFALECNAT